MNCWERDHRRSPPPAASGEAGAAVNSCRTVTCGLPNPGGGLSQKGRGGNEGVFILSTPKSKTPKTSKTDRLGFQLLLTQARI